MESILRSWQVEQLGPALRTRQEHNDGSVTYEAVHDVTLRFTVIGNDAGEFIETIQRGGVQLKSMELAGKTKGRKYVFE